MASRIAQLAKETGVLDTPHLAEAARRTKEYVASIADDPSACPMFPPVSEYSCGIETLSYVEGYLAGLVASAGDLPTKADMKELRRDVLHDPAVNDLIMRMIKAETIVPEGGYPPEY